MCNTLSLKVQIFRWSINKYCTVWSINMHGKCFVLRNHENKTKSLLEAMFLQFLIAKPDWRCPRCQSVQCVQCVQNVQSECSICSMCIMCTMCSMFSMCQSVHKNKTISLLDAIIKTVMQYSC